MKGEMQHISSRCTRERLEMKEGQRREAGDERRDVHTNPRCTREKHSMSSHISTFDMQT